MRNQENVFENVVWKMGAILSQPQCVKCGSYNRLRLEQIGQSFQMYFLFKKILIFLFIYFYFIFVCVCVCVCVCVWGGGGGGGGGQLRPVEDGFHLADILKTFFLKKIFF